MARVVNDLQIVSGTAFSLEERRYFVDLCVSVEMTYFLLAYEAAMVLCIPQFLF